MQPLDSMSAMVMVMHAKPSDLLRIKMPDVFNRKGVRRKIKFTTRCMKHWEDAAHREGHRRDAKIIPPDEFGRMIARDNIVDWVKAGQWRVFWVRQPTDQTWRECSHCLRESRRG